MTAKMGQYFRVHWYECDSHVHFPFIVMIENSRFSEAPSLSTILVSPYRVKLAEVPGIPGTSGKVQPFMHGNSDKMKALLAWSKVCVSYQTVCYAGCPRVQPFDIRRCVSKTVVSKTLFLKDFRLIQLNKILLLVCYLTLQPECISVKHHNDQVIVE